MKQFRIARGIHDGAWGVGADVRVEPACKVHEGVSDERITGVKTRWIHARNPATARGRGASIANGEATVAQITIVLNPQVRTSIATRLQRRPQGSCTHPGTPLDDDEKLP